MNNIVKTKIDTLESFEQVVKENGRNCTFLTRDYVDGYFSAKSLKYIGESENPLLKELVEDGESSKLFMLS
ncbi:MAG: hypothetical protein ACRC80_09285 [Waterburya sp.]